MKKSRVLIKNKWNLLIKSLGKFTKDFMEDRNQPVFKNQKKTKKKSREKTTKKQA
jgi:hypothetical protein